MYTGPEPDRPVAASSADSGSVTTRPTDLKTASAFARSFSLAWAPAAIAVAPASTRHGVLGIARTTAQSARRALLIAAVVMPAITEITRWSLRIDPASSSMTFL